MLDVFRFKGLTVADTERVVESAAAVLTNATTIFTIANGPIKIVELLSRCVTANGAGATTLRWSCDPEGAAAAITFSGISGSLALAAAETTLVLNMTALSTAPDIIVGGVSLGGVQTNGIILPPGIITTTIATGPSTGTWTHHLRYKPLGYAATVS